MWYNRRVLQVVMEVHHKEPVSKGGTDEYKNLILLRKEVHKLIHATKEETKKKYLEEIRPTKEMLKKINKYRKTVGNEVIGSELIEDGTPCAVKVASTVWSGGKGGDKIKA